MGERQSSGETVPQAGGAAGAPWPDVARQTSHDTYVGPAARYDGGWGGGDDPYDPYHSYDGYAAQYYAETQFSSHDTGAYAVVGAHDTGAYGMEAYDTGAPTAGAYSMGAPTGGYDTGAYDTGTFDTGTFAPGTPEAEDGNPFADGSYAVSVPVQRTGEQTPSDRPAVSSAPSRSGSRRRRPPARRSAFLSVAVPSACVMGVAAAAVAAVSTQAPSDAAASGTVPRPVKPSHEDEFAARIGGLTAAADDFGGRASRQQERNDLEERREAEMRKAAEEAAKKERSRPKFVSPVERRGLSAYFGMAGARWARTHTGIDFPVSYGTPVFSATDGVVSTKVNSALGNMVIVTAKDGTETWYCHLASYKLAAGAVVKAGDTIAYSGDTGNSSGPHLHFEVHPGGGGAIDPLAWLISHGVNPS